MCRCGLTGDDLNRRWRTPDPVLHPAIYHTKGVMSYVRKVLAKQIFLFCDFHGHSRKKNMFVYGCSSGQSWWQMDHEFDEDPSVFTQLEEVMGKLEPCFDKKSCRYTIEKSRETTARVVAWRGENFCPLSLPHVLIASAITRGNFSVPFFLTLHPHSHLFLWCTRKVRGRPEMMSSGPY